MRESSDGSGAMICVKARTSLISSARSEVRPILGYRWTWRSDI